MGLRNVSGGQSSATNSAQSARWADSVLTIAVRPRSESALWKGATMSEFVVFVETITSAGWLFLCGLGVIAVGFLTLDRHTKPTRSENAAKPGVRRAA